MGANSDYGDFRKSPDPADISQLSSIKTPGWINISLVRVCKTGLAKASKSIAYTWGNPLRVSTVELKNNANMARNHNLVRAATLTTPNLDNDKAAQVLQSDSSEALKLLRGCIWRLTAGRETPD